MTILKTPSAREMPFVVVDCGARQFNIDPNVSAAFPHVIIIGFEADAEECARLNRLYEGRCKFFPVAVGDRRGKRNLFVTRSPECSSFLRPNMDFLSRFRECAAAAEVVETTLVPVVSLDQYLPEMGITQVDLLKLDVQGVELDVLRGSQRFLQSDILAVQVEVEFSEMYHGQPLFADVDAYIRDFQFTLFDLSRVRYRRRTLPPKMDTRAQLLWGDALYLRDYRYFRSRSMKQNTVKLAVLASAYGFHDYAIEILQHLLSKEGEALADSELTELEHSRETYLSELSRPGLLARLVPLVRLAPFRAAMHKAVQLHRLVERRKFAQTD